MDAGKTLLTLAFLAFSALAFSQSLVLTDSKGKTKTIKPGHFVEIEVANGWEKSKYRETWRGVLLQGGKDSIRMALHEHEIWESKTDSSNTFRKAFFDHHHEWHLATVPIQNWRSVSHRTNFFDDMPMGEVIFIYGMFQAFFVAPLSSFRNGNFDKRQYWERSKAGWIAMPIGVILSFSIGKKTIKRF